MTSTIQIDGTSPADKSRFIPSARALNKTFELGLGDLLGDADLDGDLGDIWDHFIPLFETDRRFLSVKNSNQFVELIHDKFCEVCPDRRSWSILGTGTGSLKANYNFGNTAFVVSTDVDFTVGLRRLGRIVPVMLELKPPEPFHPEDLASIVCNGVEELFRMLPHMRVGCWPEVFVGFGHPCAFLFFKLKLVVIEEETNKCDIQLEFCDEWNRPSEDGARVTPWSQCSELLDPERYNFIGRNRWRIGDTNAVKRTFAQRLQRHPINMPHYRTNMDNPEDLPPHFEKAFCLRDMEAVIHAGAEFIFGRMLDNQFTLDFEVSLFINQTNNTLIVQRTSISGQTCSEDDKSSIDELLQDIYDELGIVQRDPRFINFIRSNEGIIRAIDFELMSFGERNIKFSFSG